MQQCACGGKWCNGLVQKTDPRKIINGAVYSLHCGWRKEKEDKKEKEKK
jgi:hypothetical protein